MHQRILMCLNRSSNKHHNLVWRCFRQCQFRTSSYRQTWLVMRLGPFAWLGMHFATLDPWSRAWHLDSLTGFCSCWLAWKGRNQFGNRLTESWAAADAQNSEFWSVCKTDEQPQLNFWGRPASSFSKRTRLTKARAGSSLLFEVRTP